MNCKRCGKTMKREVYKIKETKHYIFDRPYTCVSYSCSCGYKKGSFS